MLDVVYKTLFIIQVIQVSPSKTDQLNISSLLMLSHFFLFLILSPSQNGRAAFPHTKHHTKSFTLTEHAPA